MARSFYDLSIFSYTIIIPKSLGLIQLQPSIEQLRTSKNKHVSFKLQTKDVTSNCPPSERLRASMFLVQTVLTFQKLHTTCSMYHGNSEVNSSRLKFESRTISIDKALPQAAVGNTMVDTIICSPQTTFHWNECYVCFFLSKLRLD